MKEYIAISDFDYNLPDNKIAKYPLKERDASKLLIFNKGNISEDVFINLDNHVGTNDLLVFNDTRVIQARLIFQKETGAKIEIFCLEPYSPSEYYQAFQQTKTCSWKCLVGNLKKWKDGKIFLSTTIQHENIEIVAERLAGKYDWQEIKFSWRTRHTFGEILEHVGKTPIPRYLHRSSEEIDKTRYQTIYSHFNGSVAAPTAGLHFTKKVLTKLNNKGVNTDFLTLHVGAGTFRPVKDGNAALHQMHTEHFFVKKELLENLINHEDSIVAIGTTSLRTLESLYWIGVKLIDNKEYTFNIGQWEPYRLSDNYNLQESLNAILDFCVQNKQNSIEASTQIMVIPGYKFKVVKKLITNFHQPKSTLLLLVSAFVGNKNWKSIYDYALENNFRFLSYGDSSLLIP